MSHHAQVGHCVNGSATAFWRGVMHSQFTRRYSMATRICDNTMMSCMPASMHRWHTGPLCVQCQGAHEQAICNQAQPAPCLLHKIKPARIHCQCKIYEAMPGSRGPARLGPRWCSRRPPRPRCVQRRHTRRTRPHACRHITCQLAHWRKACMQCPQRSTAECYRRCHGLR